MKVYDLSKPQGDEEWQESIPCGLAIMPSETKLVDKIFSDSVIHLCDLYSIWFQVSEQMTTTGGST